MQIPPLFQRTVCEQFGTLAGRINAVKMNILPKMLFLFQTIPILIRKSFFTSIDKIISTFIWNKKRPRIWKAYLQRLKPSGGMGLPNFKLYYWACNLHAFSFWSHFDKQAESPIWVQMEHNSCYLTSLIALLFSPMPLSLQYVRNNPIVTQSLKLWSIIRKNYGWQSGSLLAPVHPTQLFSPSIRDDSYGI